MESGKLKYLQPMCETLVQSIETISREFYRISQLLLDLLPNTYDIDNLITRFNSGFILEGELTYEKLKVRNTELILRVAARSNKSSPIGSFSLTDYTKDNIIRKQVHKFS